MLNRDRPAPSSDIIIEYKRISSDRIYGISGDEYASEGVYFSPKLGAYDCPSANDDLNWIGIHGAYRRESYGSDPVGEVSIEFDFLVNSAGFDLRSNVGITFNRFMDSTLQDSFDIAVAGISRQPFPESFSYGSTCAGSVLFVSIGFLTLRTINSSQRKALNSNEA